MSAAILEVDDLTVRRGNKIVVDKLSLRVETGRIAALLGPNGAGKSSLVLALAGILPIESGCLRLAGREFLGLGPDEIRRLGIAAVPEGHQVLTDLSVEDNLKAAASMLDRKALIAALQRTYEVFPELRERRRQLAGTLSGGQQQMLSLGHALMTNPSFVLIDEMSLGLAPIVVRRLMGVVEDLARRDVGVLLIEQFTHIALKLADRAYVMSRARIRFEGAPRTLDADPSLLHAAYLSTGYEYAARTKDGGDVLHTTKPATR